MIDQQDIAKIRDSVLFHNIPDNLMAALLRGASRRTLGRGETLFVQEDPALNMYVILSGTVKLTRLTPLGGETVVAVYTDGQSFGEAAALMGGSFPVTASAAVPTELVQVRASNVTEALQREPKIAAAMLSCAYRHLHELVMEVEGIKALNGAQRLATFLVSIAPSEHGSCSFSLPYDKVLIAGRLGMKPESLSRSFSGLREQGVTVSRQQVLISDMDVLKRFICADEIDPESAINGLICSDYCRQEIAS